MSSRRLPTVVYQALLVPEVLALLPVLVIHKLLGGSSWAALLGIGLVLLFGVRVVLLYSARHQLRLGHYQQAERLLRAALRIYPRSADAQGLLASAALAQGEPEQAERALRRAVAYLPGQARFHAALSGALIEQERLHEARLETMQALAYRPQHAVALLHLAGIERALQSPAAAVHDVIERGLAAMPDGADEAGLRCVLAEVLAEEGQPAKALLELRRVYTLLPTCSVPQQAALHCHIGALLRQIEQPEQAVEHFHTAEKLDPHGRYAQLAWHSARS